MKDLVEYIVKSIVNNQEAVVVIQEQGSDGEVKLTLTVDPSDMGLVIGKNGQTIKAVRKLLTVRAMAENQRVYLQIAEPEGDSKATEDKNSDTKSEPEENPQESDEN